MSDIEIAKGYPAAYLKEADALCIADLHLGYEEALAESCGIALPSRQLQDVQHKLKAVFSEYECECKSNIKSNTSPSKLIINGDLKHVFSAVSKQEWKEVPMFINFALNFFEEIILVRGNHDTFLSPLKRFSIRVVNELRIGNVLFVHGHTKDFDFSKEEGIKEIMVAHEHPVLVLGDNVGARVKLPCFLKGKIYGKNLFVMPAFSPLAGGTPINIATKEEFLTPILRSKEVEIEEMEVYAIDEEVGLLKFPELKKWKSVSLCL